MCLSRRFSQNLAEQISPCSPRFSNLSRGTVDPAAVPVVPLGWKSRNRWPPKSVSLEETRVPCVVHKKMGRKLSFLDLFKSWKKIFYPKNPRNMVLSCFIQWEKSAKSPTNPRFGLILWHKKLPEKNCSEQKGPHFFFRHAAAPSTWSSWLTSWVGAEPSERVIVSHPSLPPMLQQKGYRKVELSLPENTSGSGNHPVLTKLWRCLAREDTWEWLSGQQKKLRANSFNCINLEAKTLVGQTR